MEIKLTKAGENILLSALVGNATINFKALAIGAGANAGESAVRLSDQRFSSIIDQDHLSVADGFAKLEVIFNNSAIKTGFRATEIGVMVMDPNDENKTILYAYGYTPPETSDYIGPATDQILETKLDVLAYVGNAKNITASISQSLVYATKDHNHDAENITKGVFPPERGGTGKSSFAKNGILYASGAAELSQVSVPQDESLLLQNASAPEWLPTSKLAKRAATLTVGTSTNGWTKRDCDYLCDGASDQIEINEAIAATKSGGGTVLLLDGTYNIDGNIAMSKEGVELRGTGGAKLIFAAKTEGDTKSSFYIYVAANKCRIKNLILQGSQSASSSESFHVIFAKSCKRILVAENTIHNGDVYLENCENSVVAENFVGERNGYNRGIRLYSGSGNNISRNDVSGAYYGIDANKETDLCVNGNSCIEHNEYGACFRDCDGVAVNGNVFSTKVGGLANAISCFGCKLVAATGNILELANGLAGSCVQLVNTNYFTLSANVINQRAFGYAIYIDNDCVSGIVTGNMITCSDASTAINGTASGITKNSNIIATAT